MKKNKKILVVGAGGFTGGFICSEALGRGYEVWAGIRQSTSRRWLSDPRLKFLVLDFENPDSLAPAFEEALPDGDRWDFIVYNLGATKALRFADFSRINYDYLRYFTDALRESDKIPDKLLYMSSLSVLGPLHEKDGRPFTETDIPSPNTKYGASKLKAEMWLATCGIPSIIFRCTGIYGPRDHDYFLMFESIAKGVDFSVGFKPQNLSFLYVGDLARAVVDALEKAPAGETFNIAEPRTYTQKEFRRLALRCMGRRFALPLRMPLPIVKIVSAIAEKYGVARMKPSTLNRDKFNIMRQRNWAVDSSKATASFGFRADTPLPEGISRTISWYKDEGWLK